MSHFKSKGEFDPFLTAEAARDEREKRWQQLLEARTECKCQHPIPARKYLAFYWCAGCQLLIPQRT